MKLMKLRNENGVLLGDIPDSEWGGGDDWIRCVAEGYGRYR